MAENYLPAAIRLIAAGRFADAERLLDASPFPPVPEALRLKALCLSSAGREREAERILHRLARATYADHLVHADLGVLYFRAERWSAAIRSLTRAVALCPEDRETAIYLAAALRLAGRSRRAIDAFRALLREVPDDELAQEGLYQAALDAGNLESVLPDLMDAIRRAPRSANAHGLMAEIYFQQGCGFVACEHLRRERATNRAEIESIRLHHDLARPGSTPASQRRLVSGWVDRHVPAPSRRALPAIVRRRKAPLRIGYLTGEFTRGPAYYFIYPLIAHSNPEAVRLYGYHSRAREDDRTESFRRHCSRFHNVHQWTDERIFDQIRKDRIDVLVELSGHFDDQRLAVFRHRPAPVSFSFPNYPSTTGVPEIDYIFTDRWVDPPGSPAKYVEQPWRLECGYLSFVPMPGAPPLTEPPVVRNGYITFGVLQQSLKFNSIVWDALAAAMAETPRSRMIIRYNCDDLNNRRSAAVERMRSEFRRRGISPDRVRFGANLPRYDYMDLRRDFDIALDTFPYNGQTTTCDNLWMGVPTVTLTGDTHVSRVGYSLLARMGLEDWVAHSVEEYAAIASRQAANVRRLVELRHTLRPLTRRVLHPKPLCREVEQAYMEAYSRVDGSNL